MQTGVAPVSQVPTLGWRSFSNKIGTFSVLRVGRGRRSHQIWASGKQNAGRELGSPMHV